MPGKSYLHGSCRTSGFARARQVSSSDDPELATLTAADNMMVQQRIVPHLMDG
jgi:hypothetical protein